MSTFRDPRQSNSWQKLQLLARQAASRKLSSYFAADPNRTSRLSFSAAGLHADFSRHHLDDPIFKQLLALAEEQQLEEQIQALFAAEPINITENRPAMHMALRGSTGTIEMQQAVSACLTKMQGICTRLQQQSWLGYSGKPITDVVNLGIGGSDLGPKMVATALKHEHNSQLNVHFVSNVDPCDLEQTLAALNPDTTLFVVVSKSWSTLETLSNADTAKAWLKQIAGDADISNHFVAISSRPDRCVDYGIREDNVLPMWDWVGGRYSLWSAVGLSIALATSFETFQALLAGASKMDQHFSQSALESNLPVMMGLLEVWYCNFWDCQSLAVLPYCHNLRLLPDHLQQLIMESNGKSTDRNNQLVDYATCPVIWGAAGTNGQHSFHQLLHQGTGLIPVDFILPLNSHSSNQQQQRQLVANCLAQAEVLMDGQSLEQLQQLHPDVDQSLLQHRVMPGNKPSTLICMDDLTPESLGALIALYEHKVFVASAIWNINAFDQWGVELGKVTSSTISQALESDADLANIDNHATAASIQYILKAGR